MRMETGPAKRRTLGRRGPGIRRTEAQKADIGRAAKRQIAAKKAAKSRLHIDEERKRDWQTSGRKYVVTGVFREDKETMVEFPVRISITNPVKLTLSEIRRRADIVVAEWVKKYGWVFVRYEPNIIAYRP